MTSTFTKAWKNKIAATGMALLIGTGSLFVSHPTSASAATTPQSVKTAAQKQIVQESSSPAHVVTTAGNKYIGKSTYVFGAGRNARDISRGRFDCSGFVHWSYAQAGVKVGASTATMTRSGKRVKAKDMKPGDMVFFDTYKKNGHVGIYLGNGKFIGSQSSTGVAVASMSKGYWKNRFKGYVIRVI